MTPARSTSLEVAEPDSPLDLPNPGMSSELSSSEIQAPATVQADCIDGASPRRLDWAMCMGVIPALHPFFSVVWEQ